VDRGGGVLDRRWGDVSRRPEPGGRARRKGPVGVASGESKGIAGTAGGRGRGACGPGCGDPRPGTRPIRSAVQSTDGPGRAGIGGSRARSSRARRPGGSVVHAADRESESARRGREGSRNSLPGPPGGERTRSFCRARRVLLGLRVKPGIVGMGSRPSGPGRVDPPVWSMDAGGAENVQQSAAVPKTAEPARSRWLGGFFRGRFCVRRAQPGGFSRPKAGVAGERQRRIPGMGADRQGPSPGLAPTVTRDEGGRRPRASGFRRRAHGFGGAGVPVFQGHPLAGGWPNRPRGRIFFLSPRRCGLERGSFARNRPSETYARTGKPGHRPDGPGPDLVSTVGLAGDCCGTPRQACVAGAAGEPPAAARWRRAGSSAPRSASGSVTGIVACERPA